MGYSPLEGLLCGNLDPFESGFRPGCRANTVLVSLVDDLTHRQLDRRSESLLGLLDLSVALNTIDLSGMGLGLIVLQWFKSFLDG